MLDLNTIPTLAEAFAPGVGSDPKKDNAAGTVLKSLTHALKDITMAKSLDESRHIKTSTIEALCTAIELLEDIFSEIE